MYMCTESGKGDAIDACTFAVPVIKQDSNSNTIILCVRL